MRYNVNISSWSSYTVKKDKAMVVRKHSDDLKDDQIYAICFDNAERQHIDQHIDGVTAFIFSNPKCRPNRFIVEFVLPDASITPYALYRVRNLYHALPTDCILMVAFVIAPGLISRLLSFLIRDNHSRYPQVQEAIFETPEGANRWLQAGFL